MTKAIERLIEDIERRYQDQLGEYIGFCYRAGLPYPHAFECRMRDECGREVGSLLAQDALTKAEHIASGDATLQAILKEDV